MRAAFKFPKVPDVFELIEIEPTAMHDLQHGTYTRGVVAFPIYFDVKKRVWPKPCAGCEVRFYDEDGREQVEGPGKNPAPILPAADSCKADA